MASALYGLGRDSFLNGGIDWTTGPIRSVLVEQAYTVSIDVHQYHSDLTNIAATSANMTTSSSLGIADASDVTFTSVGAGSAIYYVIVYDWSTGVSGTSQLIAYIDTGTGLPVTPNGGDIVVSWSDGTNKIFKL